MPPSATATGLLGQKDPHLLLARNHPPGSHSVLLLDSIEEKSLTFLRRATTLLALLQVARGLEA